MDTEPVVSKGRVRAITHELELARRRVVEDLVMVLPVPILAVKASAVVIAAGIERGRVS